MTINWLSFFRDTLSAIEDDFAIVLTASGCREGWLQGELYRAGREFDLRVNAYAFGNGQKADLYCTSDVPMVAEIKIVGADHYPKMRYLIEEDVRRLRERCPTEWDRFMILVIPHSILDNKLGRYLLTCTFSDNCLECGFSAFKLRVWRV